MDRRDFLKTAGAVIGCAALPVVPDEPTETGKPLRQPVPEWCITQVTPYSISYDSGDIRFRCVSPSSRCVFRLDLGGATVFETEVTQAESRTCLFYLWNINTTGDDGWGCLRSLIERSRVQPDVDELRRLVSLRVSRLLYPDPLLQALSNILAEQA